MFYSKLCDGFLGINQSEYILNACFTAITGLNRGTLVVNVVVLVALEITTVTFW